MVAKSSYPPHKEENNTYVDAPDTAPKEELEGAGDPVSPFSRTAVFLNGYAIELLKDLDNSAGTDSSAALAENGSQKIHVILYVIYVSYMYSCIFSNSPLF